MSLVTRVLALPLALCACAVLLGAQDDELPEGPGKRILVASCTNCHELDEVTKLRGFYNKDQWRDVVRTMIEYGAEMKKGEDEVLVDYLNQHFGKKQ
jgi:hypothetical protein